MAEGGDVNAAGDESSYRSQKFSYDWYQTDSIVVVTVFFKNIKIEPESLQTECIMNVLKVRARHPDGLEYALNLNLAHPVTDVRTRVFPSKMEIKLSKTECIWWTSLEGSVSTGNEAPQIPAVVTSTGPPKYPSSAPVSKDWDRVVKDLDKEEGKPEGDAALNELFQSIYSQGSDEVKRAMNKSFQESGGTVLSTNWQDVSKEKVDIKPPEGMEWRKWD